MTSFHPFRVGRSSFAIASVAAMAVVLATCSGAATAPPTAVPTAGPTAAQPTPGPTLAVPAAAAAATPSPGATSVLPAATSVVPVLPAAAGQPQTIHLMLHPINDTVGSLTGCSNAGSCQGDFMVGDDPLFDAATGKEVGTLAYECFLVDVGSTLYHCPGVTITLTGRGQIVLTEVIEHEPGKPPAIAPITGGTGEFLGAKGTVTAKVLSSAGDFVITITN